MATRRKIYVFWLQLTLITSWLFLSQSLHAAIITQNQFLGFSNISNNDISCTAPVGPFGGCFVQVGFDVSQAGTAGPIFNRFDSSLGTLNTVNLSYNLQSGGVWISRPENSILSVSTDFSYRNSILLEWANIGAFGSVLQRDPIDLATTSGDFNYRVSQETDSWSQYFPIRK